MGIIKSCRLKVVKVAGGERYLRKWGDDDLELVPIGPVGLDMVTESDYQWALWK
jgi:hypothetical protein